MRLGVTLAPVRAVATMATVRLGETPAGKKCHSHHLPHRVSMLHGPERLQHRLSHRVSISRDPGLHPDLRQESMLHLVTIY